MRSSVPLDQSAASGRSRRYRRVDGFTLIENLVTMVIMLVGLLGVIGMQMRASGLEFESYQRSQALTLAREMAARVAGSRGSFVGYIQPDVSSLDGSVYVGAGVGASSFQDAAGACTLGLEPVSQAKYEVCRWGQALLGASAKEGGLSTGAMIDARGCLIEVRPATEGAHADFFVVVVWRGVTVRRDAFGVDAGDQATPASQCASAVSYGTGLRRGLAVRVLVPNLARTL